MEAKEVIVNNSKAKRRNKILFLLRILIGFVILYFLFMLVEWQNIESAYRTAKKEFIIFAGVLLFANIGLRVYKWHIILFSLSHNQKFDSSFSSLMLGITLGSLTPGELGDFAGRALNISEIRKSHVVGLTLFDKMQIFFVTGLFGAFGIMYITFKSYIYSFLGLILFLVLSLIIFFRFKSIGLFLDKFNSTFIVKSWFVKVIEGFSLIDSKMIFKTIIITIIFHLTIVFQMYLLVNAFSEITFANALIGTSAMLFAKSIIPISFSDLGIREAGSIFFFSNFNVSLVAALNASLLLFFINIFIPGIIGVYFLRHQNISYLNTLINNIYHSFKNDRDNST